jgi:hypothetical protein
MVELLGPIRLLTSQLTRQALASILPITAETTSSARLEATQGNDSSIRHQLVAVVADAQHVGWCSEEASDESIVMGDTALSAAASSNSHDGNVSSGSEASSYLTSNLYLVLPTSLSPHQDHP